MKIEESAGCITVVGAWFIWNAALSEPVYGKYLSSGVCEHSLILIHEANGTIPTTVSSPDS